MTDKEKDDDREPLLFPRKPPRGADGLPEDEPFWYEEDDAENLALAQTITELQREAESERAVRNGVHDLEQFVTQYIARVQEAPSWRDETVFHPSQLHDGCQKFEVFLRAFPGKVKAITEAISDFDEDRYGYFAIGKAIHKWCQEGTIGKARVLKGTWECSRCGDWISGFMPNEPCSKCGWPMHPVRWLRLTKKKLEVLPKWHDKRLACKTVCRWPGGFDNPKRDCALCEWTGHWEYVEPAIVHPELEVFGHCDGVIVLDDEEMVLELKTCSPFVFPNLDAPRDDHVFQANTYMHVLGVKRALIAYVSKGNGRIRTFVIKYSEKLWKRAKKFIQSVQSGVRSGRLPEGVCDSSREKRAKECPFREECFSGYDTVDAIKRSLEKQAAAKAAYEAKWGPSKKT